MKVPIRWFQGCILLTAVAALGQIIFVTQSELRKGTDSELAFWIYTRYGSLENYRKSGRVYNSTTAVLASSSHGTFVGADGFNTDKMERHNYTDFYDLVLGPYFSRRVSLMEVGVRKGGSLKMWRELFSFDSHIMGIDISPYAPQFPLDNIKVLRGSTTNSEERPVLAKMLAGEKFDIVVDDGDHHAWSQYLTFTLLSQFLKPTGVYIIEDTFQDEGRFRYYVSCGYDVSVHRDKSGERLTILYPPDSIAKRTDLGRIGNLHRRISRSRFPNGHTARSKQLRAWKACVNGRINQTDFEAFIVEPPKLAATRL